MPVQYEAEAEIPAFAGLVVATNPENIPDNALQQCHNFVLGPSGELQKRPARVIQGAAWTVGTTMSEPFFLAQCLGFNNNAMVIASPYSPDKTYYTSDTTFGVFNEITSLAGKSAQDAVQYLSKMYIAASDGIYEWTSGATATLISGSPTGCISIILFQNRLFAITGSRVYYSGAGQPTTWGTQYISIAEGDGDTLTAIVALGDRILLFKQTSIWVLYISDDPNNWQVRGVAPDVGCVGPRALVNSRGLIYFLHMDGLYISDGVALSRISDAVAPLFGFRGRSRGGAYYDTISVYNDYLVLKICCSTTFSSDNNTTLFYRYQGQLKGFTSADGILGNVPTPASFIGDTGTRWAGIWPVYQTLGSGLPPFWCTYSKAGQFFKVVDQQVDQVTGYNDWIRCYFRTKSLNFGKPTRYKRVKYAGLILWGDSFASPASTFNYGNLQYYWVVDQQQGDVQNIWNEGLQGTHNFKLRGSGYGRAHSFFFTEMSYVTGLHVLGLDLIHMLARQQDRSLV